MSPSGEAGADDLFDRHLAAARAFMRAPSLAAMRVMTASYTLYYVARTGSEEGLAPLLKSIEANARNIMSGRP